MSVGLDPTTVPCVVALFKSEAMARRRVALHAALDAAGLRLVELFEDGNTYTYPGDHVYVLLNTCSDDAVAATIAAKYSSNPVLAATVQVTVNWLTMVSPGGCCQGVGFVYVFFLFSPVVHWVIQHLRNVVLDAAVGQDIQHLFKGLIHHKETLAAVIVND